MSVTLSYPGVYIEEAPSSVRTITAVPTSITAFVGRALRGPVDTPVRIHSFADFERAFGGMWTESHLGYSVNDFFRLGGSDAIIVRVATATAAASVLTLGTGSKAFTLTAASPGRWGDSLVATLEITDTATPPKTFQVTVQDTATGTTEVFRNLVWSATAATSFATIISSTSSLVTAAPPSAFTATLLAVTSTLTTNGSDGDRVETADIQGDEAAKTGMYALENADLFNLLVIPPYPAAKDGGGTLISDPLADFTSSDVAPALTTIALAYAEARRAIVVIDPPSGWASKTLAVAGVASIDPNANGAAYFPRINEPNPSRGGMVQTFAPSGAVAGIIARTDANRGVWKTPAGIEASLDGVTSLTVPLTDPEIGELNPLGLNSLRLAPGAGHVVWGGRTRRGNDQLADQWKYLSVRRMALHIEESLYRGTQWAVFEPNDEPLWSQLRLNIGAFMNDLFRKGAFQGATARQAYFVHCDKDTTPQSDIDRGVVNAHVGFAPLKPAEFVVVRLQQVAGQLSV